MNKQEVINLIFELLQEYYIILDEKDYDTQLFRYLDSLNILSFQYDIENKFNISFNQEDIKYYSINKIINYIWDNLNK